MASKEQQEYEKWLAEKKAILRAAPILLETPEQKRKRINTLMDDFDKFCKYYFEDFIKADFAWFHKKAAKEILPNPNLILVAEWPREHAKSVFFDIFIPLYLYAKGELTGMMIGSANETKANGLLADIQEQLMFNKRFINDFGEQYRDGKWSDGYFVTAQGIGFWAFGRGQSPRGTRNSEKRPNYGVVDDIDDAQIVKNEDRVDEAVDWVLGDFYGAMPTKGSRLVIAGNRVHKKSILAKIVGDIEPDDPVNPEIVHIKVYALENKKHEMDLAGQPAWKENYTPQEIQLKMRKMGSRIALRELFHQHIVVGRVFKEEHLPWAKLPPISTATTLVTYCDPSFKGTKKNDFKAIALVAKNGIYFDIYKVFCRQCLTPEMVRGHYHLAEMIPQNKTCTHWMEANFIQDSLLKDYDRESEECGYHIGIRGDYRKKPEKEARIEALSSYTERQLIRFNVAEKHNPDMKELRDQFLGFPNTQHDDGPDAVEGAIFKLNKKSSGKAATGRTGRYTKNKKRRITL